MNKNEIITALRGCNPESGFVCITCDIASGMEVCYPNERILVGMKTGNAEELKRIRFEGFWTVCLSIEDFINGIVYGINEARKSGTSYYVSDFIKVEPYNKLD